MTNDSEQDPVVIFSSKSRTVSLRGATLDVYIYRLPLTKWTLEILDADGRSTVWDEQFGSDEEAYFEFEKIMAGELQDVMPTTAQYLH